MQALENFESEIKKAFENMAADFERHKGIFARLEEDLKTVKVLEKAGDPGDHSIGNIVEAVYNLGFVQGYTQGERDAREQAE